VGEADAESSTLGVCPLAISASFSPGVVIQPIPKLIAHKAAPSHLVVMVPTFRSHRPWPELLLFQAVGGDRPFDRQLVNQVNIDPARPWHSLGRGGQSPVNGYVALCRLFAGW
jgi:hypothetical protein